MYVCTKFLFQKLKAELKDNCKMFIRGENMAAYNVTIDLNSYKEASDVLGREENNLFVPWTLKKNYNTKYYLF